MDFHYLPVLGTAVTKSFPPFIDVLNSFDYACQCRRGVRAVCKRDTHNRGHSLHPTQVFDNA